MNCYGTLPTLQDGAYTIGESLAQLRYLAIKFNQAYYPINDPCTCAWIDFAMESFASNCYKKLIKVLYPVMGFMAAPDDPAAAIKDTTEAIDIWTGHFLKGKFV